MDLIRVLGPAKDEDSVSRPLWNNFMVTYCSFLAPSKHLSMVYDFRPALSLPLIDRDIYAMHGPVLSGLSGQATFNVRLSRFDDLEALCCSIHGHFDKRSLLYAIYSLVFVY